MTKIQIYPDVGLSAVKDIENIGFNRISTLVYLEHSRKFLWDTLQFLSCTKKRRIQTQLNPIFSIVLIFS